MKPGDMVMVVRPVSPEFAGAIGQLLALETHKGPSGAVYFGAKIEFPRAMPWKYPGKKSDYRTGWMRASRVIVINDPPGQDETLSWCPVPQPIKETA